MNTIYGLVKMKKISILLICILLTCGAQAHADGWEGYGGWKGNGLWEGVDITIDDMGPLGGSGMSFKSVVYIEAPEVEVYIVKRWINDSDDDICFEIIGVYDSREKAEKIIYDSEDLQNYTIESYSVE